ncbi:hypothetical protein H8E88_31160 [candidate division KSB1 bacterium]|nr:hypothetical protein [candidate division KSB1 bacterium]MBL7092380.1 hypothetical protein [candidate division KSB1 bacterium]
MYFAGTHGDNGHNSIKWLHDLVLFEKYGGDWDKYLNVIYQYFSKDFIENKPRYKGIKLALKKHPMEQGKEATFWHLISTGKTEEDRIPDFRRCERIRWPKPIIEHDTDGILKVWKNKRKSDTRICMWLEDEEYLVILSERKGYLLLWTAYMVTRSHTKRKLQKEYTAYKNAKAVQ